MPTPPLRLHGDHKGRDDKPYRPSPELLTAVDTALLLETPLLLAGEPGCGKTDFAWYAARALAQALNDPAPDKALPLECYIHSDTSAADLLYQYDALARFADSQHPPTDKPDKPGDPRNYIALEPLGRALMSRRRCVLLIDEIDKAPRDLSNDLLRELDQGRFAIREIPKHLKEPFPDPDDGQIDLLRDMHRPTDDHGRPLAKPLLIVTSNAERQLPDAFLRRCVYFYIHFPKHDKLVQILQDRVPNKDPKDGGLGLSPAAHEAFLDHGVTVAEALRQPALRLSKRPGTAEIIGWVRSLFELGDLADAKKLATAAQALGKQQGVAWNKLPGLHCLVKLKDDLDILDKLSLKSA